MRKFFVRAAILASCTMPSIGLAQTADEATADSATEGAAGAIGDIVVTAQRRAETLQRVPISVTAITAEGIANAGLQSTNDLANTTPGLQMNMARNVVSPYLRGVGTQNSGAGEEGSIATYIDGIYVSALSSATLAFNNVERVEVLKGPQGTLFGRNATGGLIQIITKDPSYDLGGEATIGYANYDTVSGSGYITTGLTDTIAVDFGGTFSRQGDGWGKNVSGIAGLDGKDVNYTREWAVRSKLMFEPSDVFKVTLAGDYNFRDSDIGVSRQVLDGPQLTCRGQICDIPAVAARITPAGGDPILTIPYSAAALGRTIVGGRFDTANGLPRYGEFETYGVSLIASYEIGDVTLSSTTARRWVTNDQNFDQDGGPVRLGDTFLGESTKTFQQELLLVGTTGPLDFTLGLFYFHANAGVTPLAVRSIVPSNNFDKFSFIRTNSYAGFAQGTYHITESTGITAGIRYTSDKRSIDGRDIAVPAGTPIDMRFDGALINPVAPRSAKFDKVTYRFAIDQQLGDNVLLFGSYSRGFKSGVFNVINFRDPAARPETLDSIEIGIKSDLLDRRLRLNLSAFHYDYKDLQLLRLVGPGQTQILNAASAKVDGLELEALAAPPIAVGRLNFSANLSLLDARYGRFDNMPILVPNINLTTGLPTGGSATLSATVRGQRMVRSPTTTLSLGAEYAVPVGAGELGINLNYYFNSGFYADPDNRAEQKSYDLINAQLSYEVDDKWRVTAFVRNLMNKFYYAQISTSGAIGDQMTGGAPRTYGVTLGFKFGR